ncbi:MAG: hypothetical protein JXB49_34760 [Bacteroidales bacterium]|nr:hypothetical protein [Bacteroidales bacterium]
MWGENDVPEWKALIITTFMMLLNISMLLIILDIMKVFSFIRDEVPKIAIAITFLIVMLVNYYQFVSHGKFKNIAEEFKNENAILRKKKTIIIWVYIIASFLVPFGTLIIQYELFLK